MCVCVLRIHQYARILCYRLKVFKSHVVNIFREKRCQTCSLQILVQYVNDHTPDAQFDGGEVAAAVQIMTDANQIMLSDGIVFLI